MTLFIKFRPFAIFQKANQTHLRTISTTWSLQMLNSRLNRFGAPTEKEHNVMLKDNIPHGYQLIYRAPMQKYLNGVQHISTASSTLITILAVFKELSDTQYANMPLEFGPLVSHDSDIWMFAAAFIGINLIIRYFVIKFPLRIYKSDDKYLAVYLSQIPFKRIQHHFVRGSVTEVRNTFNPWRDSTYRLGDRTSLLLLDYFKTPSEFHNMCGSK